jgi:two-component system, LytTR family, sensor kinase
MTETESPVSLNDAPPRKMAMLLTVLLWLVIYCLITARGAIMNPDEIKFAAAARLLSSPVGLFLCWLIYLVLERLRRKPFWYQVSAAGLLGVPAGIIHATASLFMLGLVEGSEYGALAPLANYANYVALANFWLIFFFGWAASILALNYSHRVRFEEKMRVEAQALAHRAQMQALRYQLNPHFLFNSLNSVAALVLDGKAVEAERMIRELSSFLRSGLASDPLQDIPLSAEVAQQRAYLDIERTRFPDRLQVEIDIPPALEQALVPSFILQPLVENALKHGVASSTGLTTVRIEAHQSSDTLNLSVVDDGTGGADHVPSGASIGLRNVRQRLAARFGERCSLKTGPKHPHGFEARIELPLRFAAS